ncbi:Arm DNA-binding domain-containing protein [Thiocapsa rosea]|uniref:Uncharacterized protein DUF4102 n=1 Tax=Thiocapsa rosea TaxID=69360 RepID=A0A495VDL7_9GAMM|nr:Arm DNA-binding domain-containing protein [Thiocapsa rosea]RKT47486.1 uncharacterized protein DUF4102 [Thiocapsa rosea]
MSDKLRFTKTRIDALGPAEAGKRKFYYDADTPGLSVQVTGSGTKTFYVYRWVGGKPEKIRLGTFPAMTVEQAQRETRKLKFLSFIQPYHNISNHEYARILVKAY